MKNLPRYKKCFICGKENPIGLNVTFKTDSKKVYTSIKFKEEYIGYENRIHGGVIAGILDEAMGWSCSVKTKKMYFTVELTVKYKKPVPPNRKLKVIAEMVQQQHSICSSKAILIDQKGDILATAKGKYYPLTEEYTNNVLQTMHHEPEDNIEVTINDL